MTYLELNQEEAAKKIRNDSLNNLISRWSFLQFFPALTSPFRRLANRRAWRESIVHRVLSCKGANISRALERVKHFTSIPCGKKRKTRFHLVSRVKMG